MVVPIMSKADGVTLAVPEGFFSKATIDRGLRATADGVWLALRRQCPSSLLRRWRILERGGQASCVFKSSKTKEGDKCSASASSCRHCPVHPCTHGKLESMQSQQAKFEKKLAEAKQAPVRSYRQSFVPQAATPKNAELSQFGRMLGVPPKAKQSHLSWRLQQTCKEGEPGEAPERSERTMVWLQQSVSRLRP